MGWTRLLSQKSFVFVLSFLLLIYLFFPGRVYGPEWIGFSFLIIASVIFSIYSFSEKWNFTEERAYIIRLFWISFTIRLIVMLILYYIAINTKGWNMFYYVGAKDPQKYYRVAWEASVVLRNFDLSEALRHIYQSYNMDYSDSGFSTFLMFLIYILGLSPLLIKTVLCLVGTVIVIRGYKLSSMLFERNTARLAAIILMLYPISWFYSAVLLKEGLMVLIIMEAIISIVRLQRKFSLKELIKVLIWVVAIFFFRSAISILLAMVMFFSLIIQTKRKELLAINIIAAAVFIAAYLYFIRSTGKYGEYYQQYTQIDEFSESRISYMETINPLIAVVGTPVFASLAFISPFPSIVNVPVDGGLSHNEYYYHVAGNLFWLIFAFFSFYGLYYAIRYQRQELAPIWAFIIGYIFVLLKAMMFTSVRFSYPVKPFLLILAAYGIYRMKSKKWYDVYLGVTVVMIIVWNIVRVRGKG